MTNCILYKNSSKEIFLYGNHQVNELYTILNNSSLNKEFTFIYIKNIEDVKKLENSIIIYQISNLEKDKNTDVKNIDIIASKNNTIIKIPTFYFPLYYPQYSKNIIVRESPKYSLSPSGLFPFGDKNIIHLLLNDYSMEEIKEKIISVDFYDEINIHNQVHNFFQSIKKYEYSMDYYKWLIENYSKFLIAITPFHPTDKYYNWLINEILKIIGINEIKIIERQKKQLQMPIYPSVAKFLNLKFFSTEFKIQFYDEFVYLPEYIELYINYSIGCNIKGKLEQNPKDFIDSVRSRRIRLLPCILTCNHINEIISSYKFNQEILINSKNNYVYIDNQVTIYDENVKKISPLKGVMIIFEGTNNFVSLSSDIQAKSLTICLNSNSCVKIGKKCTFGNAQISNLLHFGGCCYIGNNFFANETLRINLYGNNNLSIGDFCLFADDIEILCSDGHAIFDSNGNLLNKNENIFIGDHCWLGRNIKILKGSYIPNNTIVASCSLVNKKFTEEKCIIGGCPAKILEKNRIWNIKNPRFFYQSL